MCVCLHVQYSRDFYLGQWLRDTQLELEKVMKGSEEDMDTLTLEERGDAPVISSSAVALQQAEVKKDMLHSLICPKNQSEIKLVEAELPDQVTGITSLSLSLPLCLSASLSLCLSLSLSLSLCLSLSVSLSLCLSLSLSVSLSLSLCMGMCRYLEGILDDRSAALVTRYLASSRALSRSFDVYLQQVTTHHHYSHLYNVQWVCSVQYCDSVCLLSCDS